MPSTRLVASILCLVPFAALAQVTPRSIGECERLKNDLAYNQCLAMFGPAAKNVAAGYASADAAAAPALPDVAPASAQPEAEASPRRGRRYRRHGRQFAMFTSGGEYRRHRRR
jgi:hypothetical protein